MSLFTNLSDLNPSRGFWAIKVRCVRVYDIPSFGGGNSPFSVECVFHDVEGNRMHGSIKRELIPMFRPILQEGKLYAMKYFVVTFNSMKYKTTESKYKILFQARTKVWEVPDSTFPKQMYDFRKFNDIAAVEHVDEARLIDVIGKVVSMGPMQTKNLKEGPTQHMDIVIEDDEKNRLACTLWGNCTEQLSLHVDSSGAELVVVILQLFRQKKYREQVNLANTYYVSRLICDSTVSEIIDSRRRIVEEVLNGGSVTRVPYSDAIMIEREFDEGRAAIRTIDQLKFNHEIGQFWVYAEIQEFKEPYGWWYLSCPKCRKKLDDYDEIYYCERCEDFQEAGKIRYRIHVQVADRSGETEFIIWDSETYKLIGKLAEVLKNEIAQDGEDVCSKFTSLSGTKAYFKVQVRGEHTRRCGGPYTVTRLTKDERILEEYGTPLGDEQGNGNEENIEQVGNLNINNFQAMEEEFMFAPPNSPVHGSKEEFQSFANAESSSGVKKEDAGMVLTVPPQSPVHTNYPKNDDILTSMEKVQDVESP